MVGYRFNTSLCAIFLLLQLENLCSLDIIAPLPATEYNALFDLYNATNGPNWRVSDSQFSGVLWNFSSSVANPCTDNWDGVQCTVHGYVPNQQYHVWILDLTAHELTGRLPKSIGNFPFMTRLNLPSNRIAGPIPESIGNLSQLVQLGLKSNFMSGTIPLVLGSLTNLTHLGIDYNLFTGTVPEIWDSYTNMSAILLSHNLLHGTIPASIGRLATLLQLYLSYNQLVGTIPESLGNLPQLRFLELEENYLTGSIPSSMQNLTYLASLGLHSNYLAGALPDYLHAIVGLQYLFLQDNYLTGSIAASYGQLAFLEFLEIENNLLTGSLPPELANATNLRYIYVNGNHLTGSLPRSFSGLRRLNALLVHENNLEGSLEGVFNHTTQLRLNTVQLSNNQFTGTLPYELFLLNDLSALVAVSNCFEGTLPSVACQCDRLYTLTLDGISSASSCRTKLLPGLSSAYKLTHSFTGTVPPCLFRLPRLNTLHLSGNGLTGSLPADVTISDNLIDLSLAHNVLTGQIPTNIQNRAWYNLDLSYNRFSGEMSRDFYSLARNFSVNVQFEGVIFNYTEPASSAALILQSNRLSGNIPSEVRNMLNISILTGNLFSCDIPQSTLPRNDDGGRTYQCGSNLFDVPYIIWVGITVVIVGFLGLCWFCQSKINQVIGFSRMVVKFESWLSVLSMRNNLPEEVNNKLKNVSYVCLVFDVISHIAFKCGAFILLALLPVYIGMTVSYGTHSLQYAYAVSAIFTSGTVPFGLEFALLVLLMLLLVTLFVYYINQFDHIHEQLLSEYAGDRSLFAAARGDEGLEAEEGGANKFERIAVCVAFFLISVSVVLGANVAFVYVALYQSSTLFILSQVMLSLFKVAWNLVASPYLILWTSNYLYSAASLERMSSRTGFFSLQLFVSLINNIAIPCLVVMAIEPNCYYHLIVPAQSETSRYLYAECGDYANLGCINIERTVASTQYSPPFKYSYQCSSSFITYYAPTFVYVCFVSTFVSPMTLLLGQALHSRVNKTSALFRFLDFYLPPALKPVDMSAVQIQREVYNPFFDPNAFLISHLTFLCVLLTFGAMFPPLAVAVVVTMFVATYFEKLRVGRFIWNAIDGQRLGYLDIISAECQGVGSIRKLHEALWLLVNFSCCFYALFLFDTLGDAVGFDRAFWVLLVMPLGPLVVYWIRRLLTAREQHSEEKARDLRTSHATKVDDPRDTMTVELRQSTRFSGHVGRSDHDDDEADSGLHSAEEVSSETFNVLQSEHNNLHV